MITTAALLFGLTGHPVILVADQKLTATIQSETKGNTGDSPGNDSAIPNPSMNGAPAELMDRVTKTAQKFQKTYKDVEQMLRNSVHSREQGTAALQKMLQMLTAVQNSLSDKGEIWRECQTMSEKWQKNEKATADKAAQDPAFQAQADAWDKKIEDLSHLRADILQQRDDVQAKIDDVRHNQDVVLGWYDLGQADKALQGLRQMSQQLGTMSNDLTTMMNNARLVGAHAGS